MTTHADHRFSVTIYTTDLAVVNCLRSLAKYSQKTGNNQIPWGGTKDADWKASGKQVTFFFSSAEFREGFLAEIARLLPKNCVELVGSSDELTATPQKR